VTPAEIRDLLVESFPEETQIGGPTLDDRGLWTFLVRLTTVGRLGAMDYPEPLRVNVEWEIDMLKSDLAAELRRVADLLYPKEGSL